MVVDTHIVPQTAVSLYAFLKPLYTDGIGNGIEAGHAKVGLYGERDGEQVCPYF